MPCVWRGRTCSTGGARRQCDTWSEPARAPGRAARRAGALRASASSSPSRGTCGGRRRSPESRAEPSRAPPRSPSPECDPPRRAPGT